MKLSWLLPVVLLVLSSCEVSPAIIARLQTMLTPELVQTERDAAPEFHFTTYEDDEITWADFRGQIVVMNFWASWCAPCGLEAHVLEELWQQYRDHGVVFIGIAVSDFEPASRDYIAEYGITYPSGGDPQAAVANAFNVMGVPETFIIDQDGYIARHFLGPVTETELVDSIENLSRAQ